MANGMRWIAGWTEMIGKLGTGVEVESKLRWCADTAPACFVVDDQCIMFTGGLVAKTFYTRLVTHHWLFMISLTN